MRRLAQLQQTARAAWRRACRYRGMFVIILWQAPIGPAPGPDGGITFLFGGGADEIATLNCEGQVTSAQRVTYRLMGVEADYDLSPNLRLLGTGGLIRSDISQYDGPFGAVQARLELRSIGLGLGVAVQPSFGEWDEGTLAWPSAYLRAGSREGLHARADLFPPSALGRQQIIRLGAGGNALRRDRPSWFAGIAGVGGDDGAFGMAVDLDLPVAARVGVSVRGHWGSAHRHSVTGLTVGARVLLP